MNFIIKPLIVFCAVSQLTILEGAHYHQGATLPARIKTRLSFPKPIVERYRETGTSLPEVICNLRAARDLNSAERAQRLAEHRHQAEMRRMDAEIERMEAQNQRMEPELRRSGVLDEEDDKQSTASTLSFNTARSTRTRTPGPRTLSPPKHRRSTRQRREFLARNAKRNGNEEA